MRVAAYWAPPADSPLWRFAARWLGRDPATGETFPPADPRHAAITEDARRYGFHATLKAPIALADGATLDQVRAALRTLAARFTPFTTPPWVLADIGGFLALVPDPTIAAGRPPALHALADACVLALERFRRAPSPAEIARRRPERLDAQARLHLQHYGYPWVFEKFFAHLTLTCRLEPEERQATTTLLRRHLAALPAAPFAFHDIALFVEDEAGAPFRQLERIPLGVQR